MISCETFRARFAPATEDAAVLEHVRSCDACLAVALEQDPDMLFRSLGAREMEPPGGIDAFVGDVMREVRLRKTETMVAFPHVSWTRRLAYAATLAAGLTAATAVYFSNRTGAPMPVTVARATVRPVQAAARPAVEMYHSDSATIVEIPTDASEDVKVVMVFDDTLPADL
jgi:hypothetical protein